MTIAESIRSSKYETICGECGSAVMAPEFVEHFSEEQLVLNFWSCTNCGFRFETEEKLSADVEPRVIVCDEVELFPESFFRRRVLNSHSNVESFNARMAR